MRTASRFMPQARRLPLPWPGRWLLAACAAGLLWSAWAQPLAVCGGGALLWCAGAVARQRERRRLAPLVQARAGESICQFARAVDCRRVDPWVVRAVYEGLQGGVRSGAPLPLHITDRLDEDLGLDADHVDVLAQFMAQRAGRDLSHTRTNPFFDKVVTAGDLVLFLNAQPRTAACHGA